MRDSAFDVLISGCIAIVFGLRILYSSRKEEKEYDRLRIIKIGIIFISIGFSAILYAILQI